jgi:hypothetical protein
MDWEQFTEAEKRDLFVSGGYVAKYTASKGSYGTGFFEVHNTLDILKKAIVEHEMYFIEDEVVYMDDMYTEELFEKCKKKGQYRLFQIKLHPDEKIEFDEYDGASGFSIEKKIQPEILSFQKCIED